MSERVIRPNGKTETYEGITIEKIDETQVKITGKILSHIKKV